MNITQIQANSLAELPAGYRIPAVVEIVGKINREILKCFAVLKPEDVKFYREYLQENSKDLAADSAEKLVSEDVIQFLDILDETRANIEQRCLPFERLSELYEQIEKRGCKCAECQAKRGADGLAS